MARLPYPAITSPELKTLATDISAERGNHLYPLYRMLLNSPPVAAGWLRFFTAIRQQAKLPGRYRELAILYVEVLTGGEYNYRQHLRYALKEGLTQAQLEGLENWESSSLFEEADRSLLAYAKAMTQEIRVSDEVFAALKPHFDSTEIVELTATVGGYHLLTRFFQALRIDPDTDPQFTDSDSFVRQGPAGQPH